MYKKMLPTVVLMMILFSLVPLQPVTAQTSITTTDLCPPDSLEGWVYDINDLGQSVGYIITLSYVRSFLWDADGTGIELLSPQGEYFVGVAINNLGQVVGGYNSSAAVWTTDGGWTVIPPGTGGVFIRPEEINDLGQVVGWRLTRGPSGYYYNHAFLWTAEGGRVDLEEGTGGYFSMAKDINNLGQTVGDAAWNGGEGHAVLWPPEGGVIDLGTLGGNRSWVWAINDQGQVVGGSLNASGQQRAFLWTMETGMVDIGALEPNDINDLGQIAGLSQTPDGKSHAFLWTPEGETIDLGTLGGDGSTAYGLNNKGQVIGTSFSADGIRHAVLWTLQMAPPTVDEQIKALIGQVNHLVEEGMLNQGQGNSLVVKLENAERLLGKDDSTAAANLLAAFINHVVALLQANILPEEEGQAWIDAAGHVITDIQ